MSKFGMDFCIKQNLNMISFFQGTLGVMVIGIENGHSDSSSNPGQGCLYSHSVNTRGKNVRPVIFHPVMDKL